jgi:hypothetical protein
MNFLELVQKTVRRSGAKAVEPTTVVGQTGISQLFVEFVQEAWKEIQMERLGFNWRVNRDLTIALVSGTYEYGIDSGLESFNRDSLTIHLDDVDESKMYWRTYRYYQREVDRQVRADGKPQFFTVAPDNQNLIVWPNPIDTYTIEYEGINSVQTMDDTDAAGVGTSDNLTPTNLDADYHDAILWQAVRNYALHFEDGNKLSEAQDKFKPYKKYFEERYMPTVTLDTTALYSVYNSYV